MSNSTLHTFWETRAFEPHDTDALHAILRDTYDRGDLPGRQWYDVQSSLDRMQLAPGDTIVGLAEGTIVGYLTPHQQQLVVGASFRRRGFGTRLVEAGVAFARANNDAALVLAPPPGNDVAMAFATRLGFTYDSSLWEFVLPPGHPAPPPNFPTSINAKPFSAEIDDAKYVGMINTIFRDHPSPIAVTLDAVRSAHARPDFVPDNILILTNADDPADLVGFCRVRIDTGDAGERVGEISLIGVLSSRRGLGLGRELLLWGVQRLRSQSVDSLTLHVEARNASALALYKRVGFVPAQEWPRWSRPVPTGDEV